jgi:5,10-methenyltetrahydromethanopterin hydrogenase
MSQFRFIGIEAEISGHARMDRFGQAVTLPAGMGAEAAAACCIPADEFAAIFDGIAVDDYAMVASHNAAPKEFQERKRQAAAALGEFRKSTGR